MFSYKSKYIGIRKDESVLYINLQNWSLKFQNTFVFLNDLCNYLKTIKKVHGQNILVTADNYYWVIQLLKIQILRRIKLVGLCSSSLSLAISLCYIEGNNRRKIQNVFGNIKLIGVYLKSDFIHLMCLCWIANVRLDKRFVQ